ncbi:MAG: Fic family protein [Phototrophicaceae bacterium]
MNKNRYQPVSQTPYEYDHNLSKPLTDLRERIGAMRTLIGTLSPESLAHLQAYFRLKQIYNSNAIEGNTLTIGETKMVIEQGLTLTGKPLKDSMEARNLSDALDFFEVLVKSKEGISIRDIKELHGVVLRGVDDRNAGRFRTIQVRISGSQFTPPDPARINEEMDDFGKWLESISHEDSTAQDDPLILACIAHVWFVYIHPFVDGNGRTARLLMNLILIRRGYPLVILTKDDRHRYYDALEETQAGDLSSFIRLVLESALESFEVYEYATKNQLESEQFLHKLLYQDDQQLRGEYEIFEKAMGLLKGYLKQLAQEYTNLATQQGSSKRIGFREFDGLEYEKYQELCAHRPSKRTWYFRFSLYRTTDARSENAVRYLFFFGFPSPEMETHTGISKATLHIALETERGYYERLADVSTIPSPNLLEVGYVAKAEQFAYLDRQGQVHQVRAEAFARYFIEQAFEHFE